MIKGQLIKKTTILCVYAFENRIQNKAELTELKEDRTKPQ